MVTIKILDHVHNAVDYEDGDVIYEKIIEALKISEKVNISFEGIESAPSAFINASLVRLLDNYSLEFIKENISFSNSTKFLNSLIKERFDFVWRKKVFDSSKK